MLKTPCPYPGCGSPEMPEPPKTVRPFAKCPKCGRKARAVLSPMQNGTSVHYVRVGPKNTVRKWDYHVRAHRDVIIKTGMSAQELFDLGIDTALKLP